MKKTDLLNSEISYCISKLGHTQTLCIADCGLPIPSSVQRIDIALTKDIPSFLDTLKIVLSEMKSEKAFLASELKNNTLYCNKILDSLKVSNPEIVVEFVPHDKFKHLTEKTSSIIRTGEQTPYANIILQSGVVF